MYYVLFIINISFVLYLKFIIIIGHVDNFSSWKFENSDWYDIPFECLDNEKFY